MKLTKSKLMQIIKEELQHVLQEQEANNPQAWVGMNSAQVKKEMGKAGIPYEKGWYNKLPKEHPVRVKYREYWKARKADQGEPAVDTASKATGGKGGQRGQLDPAVAAAVHDAELRMASGLYTTPEEAVAAQEEDAYGTGAEGDAGTMAADTDVKTAGIPTDEPVNPKLKRVYTDPFRAMGADPDEYKFELSPSAQKYKQPS